MFLKKRGLASGTIAGPKVSNTGMKPLAKLGLVFLLGSLPVPAQGPSFDVANIKPSPDGPRNKGIGPVGRRLDGMNVSVVDMLTFSYEIHRNQIIGGPPWAESQLFDFVAQPGGQGPVSGEEWRAMLRNLLVDRFQFAFHHETRELSAFALQATGGKPGRKPSSADPTSLPNFGVSNGRIVATNVGMADLAHILQEALLDRPVVDQTQIPGKFDFTLRWTPDEFQRGQRTSPQADRPDAPPSLYEVLQEQLGVKLKSTKATVDVIVIDHVEKPSAN
jgi:uncharacterized protein (TIGR03435 family)